MSLLDQDDVFPWVEQTLGAGIVASVRQGGRESGGRPGWFVQVESAGGPTRYYVRGSRGSDFGYARFYSLSREVRILELLRSEGIEVPRVVAASSDPEAAILEHVEGENDFTRVESAEERDALARHFAEVMARWHAIPARKFQEIGLRVPETPLDYVVQDLEVWEAGHFPLLKRPIPLVSFVCGWLRRNPPRPPERPVLVQGDTGPGQFIFERGRVRAVIDWELAILGDPMRDLAHIRTRDVWYPTGNLPRWFEYYSEFSGTPLDPRKIRHYSLIAMFTTALALGPVVQHLEPRDDHAEWLAQDVWSKKATLEALLELLGLEPEPLELPVAERPEVSGLFDVLEENLRAEQLPRIQESFLRHRMQVVLRLVARLRNAAEIGPEIEALELDDMAGLLGSRPGSLGEGNRALEALVRRSGAELDERLARYFHRHALREEALMKGGLGRVERARTSPID